ncbi:Cytochrome P450 3A8 [Trichoplax sp. H2]|nr:Cytochrome P450 3A8 [Trichoplax sp. H2]|eukprot:RDD43709.1 Cytochrome P450 3A8 [Trichoplax sp. H2]
MWTFANITPQQIAWVAAVLILTLLFHYYFIHPLRYFKKLNIPGPKPYILIGSAFSKESKQINCIKKYGKVYGLLFGRRPVMVISDLPMVKDIMVKHFSNFTNRFPIIPPTPPFHKNLLAITDDDWKRVRNVLIPTFSAAKLKQIESIISSACDSLFDKLMNLNKQQGKANIWKIYGEYSMEVIMATAFGVHVTADVRGQEIRQQAASFFSTSNLAMALGAIMPSLYPYISKFMRTRVNSVHHIASVSRAIIAERRQNLQQGLTNRRDLLQLLVEAGQNGKLTDEEIISQSFIFLLAGYETTASALAYTSYLLALNPDVQQRLLDEIDEKCPKGTTVTSELVSSLPYLDMVLSESLRIYPPAYIVNRIAKNDIVIGGVLIPKDVVAAIPIYGIHHNEKLWPDPKKFIPERFTPEEKAKRHPFAHLPFGNGPRNCIGMR